MGGWQTKFSVSPGQDLTGTGPGMDLGPGMGPGMGPGLGPGVGPGPELDNILVEYHYQDPMQSQFEA